MKQMRNLNIII